MPSTDNPNVRPCESQSLELPSIHRLACKLSAAIAVSIFLAVVFTKPWHPSLLWVAAPMALIFLLDVSLETGRAANNSANAVARGIKGLVSLSVWPFYAVLAGVMIGAVKMTPPPKEEPSIEVVAGRIARAIRPQVMPQTYPMPSMMPGQGVPSNFQPRALRPTRPTTNPSEPSAVNPETPATSSMPHDDKTKTNGPLKRST